MPITPHIELNPCPFCGCGQEVFSGVRLSGDGYGDMHWVECGECGASGPYRDTPYLAAESWNRPVKPVEFKGRMVQANFCPDAEEHGTQPGEMLVLIACPAGGIAAGPVAWRYVTQ